MKYGLKLSLMLVALSLAACAQVPPPSRGVTPSVALSSAIPAGTGRIDPGQQTVLAAQYDIEAVQVIVPKSLRVSEANVFYPVADIVWHGEPLGNRRAQVQSIFEEAATNATGPMATGRKVNVAFELERFHAITAKARYTVGGVHNVVFLMTVRDAATGEILDGPRQIVADAKASGGQRAIEEDEAGRTQRIVIVERLTQVLRRELSAPVVLQPGEAVVARADGGASVVPVQ
jgi:hypothetical protein